VWVINDSPVTVTVDVKLYLLTLGDDQSTCLEHEGPEPWSISKAQCHLLGFKDSPATATAGAAAAAMGLGEGSTKLGLRGGGRAVGCKQADVPAGVAQMVWKGSVEGVLQRVSGCSAETCYLHAIASTTGRGATREGAASASAHEDREGMEMEGKGKSSAGAKGRVGAEGRTVAQGTAWLSPFKSMELPAPELQVGDFVQVSPSSVKFTVSSKRVALFVVWELGGAAGEGLVGRFSDNALAVHPCMPVEVSFHAERGDVTIEELKRKLVISSLRDHQQFGRQTSRAQHGVGWLDGGGGLVERGGSERQVVL
jgi:hypothetical protein